MRSPNRLRLGALLICLVLASAALAEVRDEAVQLTILDPPGGLAPGEPQLMTLAFTAYRDVTVDDIQLSGPGWSARQLDLTPDHLERASETRIRYEVMALDPDATLDILYRVDRVQKHTSFDANGVHWRPVASVRAGDTPPRQHPTRELLRAEPSPPTPALAEQYPEYEILAKAGPGKATTIRVRGRIVHSRRLASNLPESNRIDLGADGATVRVFDWNTHFELELASDVTDAWGYFDFSFTWWNIGGLDPYPDLFLRYESASSAAFVRPLNMIDPYSWETEIHHDYNGTDLDFGQQRAPVDGAALQILSSITRTRRWFQEDTGNTAPSLFVFWPDGDDGAWYTIGGSSIHISTEHTWHEDTHAHEYGHHLSASYMSLGSPDYCNGICDDPGHCTHCIWCEENPSDAWSEGIANWIADAVTRRWDTSYEYPPLNHRWSETIQTCDGVNFGDAFITEGAFQALLHDIEDEQVDNDYVAPGFMDQLHLGTDEILDLHISSSWTYTPENFINRFLSTYPQHATDFWETARNCGFVGIDTAPPTTPVPTSTHNGIPSPDATIKMFWAPGSDDLSGIGGYSYLMSPDAPVPPLLAFPSVDASVLEYESAPLAPGNYYFTLRAFDREGNGDPSYIAIGPLAIRTAEPGDLEPFAGLGWAYPAVPRSAADVAISVPAPTSALNQSTYWNLDIINSGETNIPSGTRSAILVDGLVRAGVAAPLMYANGHEDQNVNRGPINLQGGRHTFEGRADLYESAAEASETNNSWAKQWIWNPTVFVSNPVMDRASPPIRDGGWDAITTGTIWYNCDGLRFIGSLAGNQNAALMIVPDDPQENFDLRMHEMDNSVTGGFSWNLGYSARPERHIDVVLANFESLPAAGYDAGVLNTETTLGAGYHAEIFYGTSLTVDTPVTSSLLLDQAMELYKFAITPLNQGPQSIQLSIDTTWTDAPVYLAWYDESFTTGDLLDYDSVAITDGSGYVQIDIDAQPGLHSLIVWRDLIDGSYSQRNYSLVVGQPPSDLAARYPTGWAAPLVPRPAADASFSSAPVPTTLLGDQSSTYLNYAFGNESVGEASAFKAGAYVDGALRRWSSLTHLPGGQYLHVTPTTPYFVTGGRHTVTLRTDYEGVVPELIETNNNYGAQYVWTPSQMLLGQALMRDEPGDRTAFWQYIDGGQDIWYNCDGVRTPQFQTAGNDGYWAVVAIMPAALSDVDLRLHTASTGAQDGFADALARSYWPPSESDFVLMNFNATGTRLYDAGVIHTPGSKNLQYKIVSSQSTYRGSAPNGSYGPFTIETDALVDLHEFQFTTPGWYVAELAPSGPGIDLGLSLYGTGSPYYDKSGAFDDGINGPAMSWAADANSNERIKFKTTSSGYYCLAVWKAGSAQSDLESDYTIWVGPDPVTAVGDEPVVSQTRLTELYPNPFNPRTRIVYELALPGPVRLRVFDLKGRLVRELMDQPMPAGRHEISWDGRDGSSKTVASGSYLVRMEAGGTVETRRATMLK